MKSTFRLSAMISLFYLFTSPVQAKGFPVFFGLGGEKIAKVMEHEEGLLSIRCCRKVSKH